MKYLVLTTFSIFITSAGWAQAALVVSEVAWMGSVASPNHEWIELHNTGGDEMNVDGWTVSDGSNVLAALAGTVPAGAYVVLERTSEASAPGSAFLLYTGALVNTGTTLTVRRADGQIEDQVAGGANWEDIGGNNETKETAQYTSGGWRTGLATPGSAPGDTSVPTATGDPAPDTPETKRTFTSPATTGARSSTVPLPVVPGELELAVAAQRVAYVSQSVTFTAKPSGVGKTVLASLVHHWNFGDLTTATGTVVTHRYEYPGTYIVSLHSAYRRHSVVARQEIVVLPVAVTLSRVGDAVMVSNDSAYDIDVSGYRVQRGNEQIIFPPQSFIMAKQSVAVPQARPHRTPLTTAAVLYDAAGTVVASTDVASSSPAARADRSVTVPAVYEQAVGDPEVPLLPVPVATSPWATEVGSESLVALAPLLPALPATPTPLLESESEVPVPASGPWWPYVGLGLLLGLLLLMIYSHGTPVITKINRAPHE